MDALGDICVGNVQLGGAYAGPARMAQFVAGIPETVRSAHKNSQNCQLKMMPSYRLFPFSFSFLSIFTSISASLSVCGIIARLTLASGALAHFSHFVYNAHTHATRTPSKTHSHTQHTRAHATHTHAVLLLLLLFFGPFERSKVPLSSVNRQCSSGLQAVATIANAIKAGQIVGGIGAGVESMTHGGGVADPNSAPPPIDINEIIQNKLAKDSLTPMGVTSENVASRYGITRSQQDALAVSSHAKAIAATESGHFAKEIVPITVTVEVDDEDQEITVTKDDGPRPGTTMEKLAGLRAVFKEGGSTTAGNASQVSDGAAAVVLLKRSKANELGLPIIGAYRGYQVVGVMPDEMGVGPAVAIPAVLKECGLSIDDIDVYEINEAFASQAAYCVQKLGIPMEKVNPNGGAIALGHPLGCTGARQVATLFNELHAKNKKLGVISMCIGTGMGAAAVFEAE